MDETRDGPEEQRREQRTARIRDNHIDRGLSGVQLVIPSAHRGLTSALGRVLQGSAWQRCCVHAMRNLLTAARHEHRQLIAALIRTVFAQPDHDRARAQHDDITVGMIRPTIRQIHAEISLHSG